VRRRRGALPAVRALAQAALEKWPQEERRAFAAALLEDRSTPESLAARARWQLAAVGQVSNFAPGLMQHDTDARVRVQCLRILKDYYRNTPDVLCHRIREDVVGDPSPAVRRAALLVLRDVAPEKATPVIV